ncbi:MAG: FG-GAP-like repeat-containing protein [Anaerolineae bacterium]|nr:FG-GAP-like repeat-containing protein [Anaerolineae bacterium]
MTKLVRRHLTLLLLLAVLPVSTAQADGGLAVRPYWSFSTLAPVTHIQTGDINGDGAPEVILLTADHWVYVLENDGNLAWRYETTHETTSLLVADLDGDPQKAEIFVGGAGEHLLLHDAETPPLAFNDGETVYRVTASDLNGDGRPEIIGALGRAAGAMVDVGFASSDMFYGTTRLVLSVWVGEVDGDERPEIVPSPMGGHDVYALDVLNVSQEAFISAWQQRIEGEVGLVRAGDVDGDGLAEVVVLTTTWDLLLLENNGHPVWQQPGLVTGSSPAGPGPGQLLLQDLDGDGRAEIIILVGATVYAFDGTGRQLWQQSLSLAAKGSDSEISQISKVANIFEATGTLTGGDIDGNGQAEVLAAIPGQDAVYLLDAGGHHLAEYYPSTPLTAVVYLLDASGHRLAEYYPSTPLTATESNPLTTLVGTASPLVYNDLNGDGRGEIIIGTETGVEVFGASTQVEQSALWRSSFVRSVTDLYLADLDGDGRDEIAVGSQEGLVYILADNGQVRQQIDLKGAIVLTLNAGDVNGDDQSELVVATFGGSQAFGGGQIFLLDGTGQVWTVPIGLLATSIAVSDLNDDGWAGIICGGNLRSGGVGAVILLDDQGELLWQREFDEKVIAVSNNGKQILAATEKGRIYELTVTGEPVTEYDLGARVLDLGKGLAATADGRIYRLGAGKPTVIQELGVSPRQVQLRPEAMAMLTGEQDISLLASGKLLWQSRVDSPALRIAMGDLNGDGEVEVAVVTDQGYVHFWGQAANQPPLLTRPDLAETRTGYTYSVKVNDPDKNVVTITLEIWDPSAGLWLTQATQSVIQGQGQLNLDVPDPFDTWDSGQESRFRFRYDDGHNQGTLKEVAGPFTIPTLPWYTFYGQWVGLGALLLLPVALGFVFYRRQRAYRRSPVGRAESLLKQLRAHPDETLLRLHTVARAEPALLAYLPGLAREAGESALADMSEGFNLILTRPEVAVEGLRAVVRGAGEQGSRGAGETGVQSEALPESREAEEQGSRGAGEQGSKSDEKTNDLTHLYNLCLEALEANTVSRIVSLQRYLAEQKDSSVVTTLVVQPTTTKVVTTTESPLAELSRVAQTLHNYERVETVEDKIAYLAQAIESLGRLDREFQAALPQPERNIFSRIAFNWLMVTTNALEDLQGRAQIEASLKTRQVLNLEQTTLSLELTNTGRSPASNLTISLVPDQLYAVGNGAAYLDILPAGRSVVVELPLSAAPSVEQFRAEFAITFDDRERSGKRVAFADLVRLLKPGAAFQTMPNPYAPGTPLRPGSPIFFGRDDLFQFIAENLGGATRQNILVLIGQRRMGKTSFLQQLPARLGQVYLPVYLDGQSLGIDPGMANFFYDLSLAIADALADQGCAVAEPELADFQERPSGVFERTFLPAVFEAIGSRRLLLLFDEFEELEIRVASGKLEATIFPFFRHLMQHADKVGFVFVGAHRLEELTADYWSILFNIALYKHVTFLSEGAAKALIVEPVAQHGLLYDDLALDKIIRVTAGQPYFLQLICHALVNRANREGRGYLTIRDVNDTLNELVELGEAHFAFLWEQSSPTEQLILAALMRLLSRTPTVTATQIVELLAERGRPLELQIVREALRRLTERDIVRELGESPPRYEYKVDLVRLWVERYKALGRVIEEFP